MPMPRLKIKCCSEGTAPVSIEITN
uniref:Uncharacterized protein n=1 Tax=Arundo donax TaxID=35708 RepID=A0A0A9HRH0_ARUDO